jgi:hypothetical protein
MTLLREVFDRNPPQDYYLWLHRNIDFEPLRDYAPFQEFMRPKG